MNTHGVGLENEYSEEELEQSIIRNIRAFLIDFEAYFAFIQVKKNLAYFVE